MHRFAATLIAALLCAGSANATPLLLTHQGRVLDADGLPLNAEVDIDFALYVVQSGGSDVWNETVTVTPEDGYYTVTLGQETALTPELFDNPALWVDVTVDAVPMGRQRVVSTPYAVYSEVAANVDGGDVNASSVSINDTLVIDGSGNLVGPAGGNQPAITGTCGDGTVMIGVNPDGSVHCRQTTPSGQIAFFAGACPAGFSPYTAANGRTIVAMASGGTLEGTVGNALAAGGTRTITDVPTHHHAADPAPGTTSGAVHNHSASSSTTGNHSHSASTGNDSHNHSGSTSTTGNHGHGFYTATHDVQSSASQGYPNGHNHLAMRTTDRRQETRNNGVIQATGNHAHSVSTNTDTHSHSVSINNSGNHAHSITVNNSAVLSATFDVAPFNTTATGVAAVDVTMPYIQLNACVSN